MKYRLSRYLKTMDYLRRRSQNLVEGLGKRDYYERSNQGERQSCRDGELERKQERRGVGREGK